MWLVHGPRESILCERAFSSQEAESGIAVTILISNAQPVLYCAVEAEPRTLVAEAKLRNVSWPCPERITSKRRDMEGAGSTCGLHRLLDSWLEPPSSLLGSWQKSPAWTDHMARYQKLADRLQAERKHTACGL